jgi:hypothetical protein
MPDGGTPEGGIAPSGDGGLFASCSLDRGCVADCNAPPNDPIAATDPMYNVYDGCILVAMQQAGMTEPWMGQMLKAQAINESSIVTQVTTNDGTCGGQNCGVYAISAGASSGDGPGGPCGMAPNYSHSYGIFQSTPACEGTYVTPLPAGQTCTNTGTVDNIPFGLGVDRWYCETVPMNGVRRLDGVMVKGAINAVQTASSPYYATSVFNPAYQLFVYISFSWKYNFMAANANAKGCTLQQQWYLSFAYWLTGSATTTCTLSGSGLAYVRSAISNYQMLFGRAWPYPGP